MDHTHTICIMLITLGIPRGIETYKIRWNHMWLNEGFATFFESYAAQAIYDKSFVWQRFYKTKRDMAMYHDVDYRLFEKQTVPKVGKIKSSYEAEEAFAWMQYERGACMLAMVRSILGEKTFLSTVNKYLKKKSYSSAVSRDLYAQWFDPAKNEIEAISHSAISLENFHDFMEPWTNRSGYPVVYLVRNETDNTVRYSTLIISSENSFKMDFVASHSMFIPQVFGNCFVSYI